MPLVESKYKNPDTFIKKLLSQIEKQKEEISNLRDNLDALYNDFVKVKENAYGEFMGSYSGSNFNENKKVWYTKLENLEGVQNENN